MNTVIKNSFHFIGIAVRTSNQQNQAMQDIPQLWQRFMNEGIQQKIPNVVDPSILCLYTDYEGDHNMPYTCLIGCRVDSLADVPEGMRSITVKGGNYAPFIAKGNLQQGAVYNAWMKIWQADIDRTYSVDFEVYGEKAMNPVDAEVDIFIAV